MSKKQKAYSVEPYAGNSWVIKDGERVVAMAPDPKIRQCGGTNSIVRRVTLLAAAPELLEFVRAVESMAVRQIDGLPTNHEARRALINTRDDARSLIAKAEGGAA